MFSDNAANRDQTPNQLWGDPGGGYVAAVWNNMYVGISRCNFLLDNLDKARKNVDEATIQNVGAQVKPITGDLWKILNSNKKGKEKLNFFIRSMLINAGEMPYSNLF